MHEKLKKAVLDANIELEKRQLVICSWGNVSGIDRSTGIVAIKPSGVPYEELTADKIVLVDLDGNVVEGNLNPSSDTPTHIELYRSFESVGGIPGPGEVAASRDLFESLRRGDGRLRREIADGAFQGVGGTA